MTITLPAAAVGYDDAAVDHAVPAVKNHIGFRDGIANSLTMAYRGLLKIRRNPELLFDVTFMPVIFTLMFTYVFGGAISGSVHAYLPLVIPGVLVQTVVIGSVVTGTQLREDMDKGVFDRFRSLPIARISPLAGALLADVVRYVIATTITVIVGLCMGYRPGGGVLGVVAAGLLLALCAFAISWIFALMGVLMHSASAVQGISMLVLFPLTFMSSAFIPVASLPGWMQAFVKVNPVTHLVGACRDLMNANHYGDHLGWSLLGAAVIAAIFVPLTVRTYMRQA